MTYLEIADHFEHEINSGKLFFDQRLPSTKELAKQFGVTDPTIQRCMTRLVEKGLVYRVPKRGTFVRRNTDVGGKLAFIFGNNPFTSESRFPGLYLNALEEYTQRHQIPAKVYYVLNDSMLSDVIQSLEYDAEHEGIRCALAIHSTDSLNAYLKSQNLFPAIGSFNFDYGVIIREGIEALYRSGCEKMTICYVQSAYNYYRNANSDLWSLVSETCEINNIPESNCHIDLISPTRDDGYQYTKRMLRKEKKDQPDGMLVCDETFTHGMMSAFWEEGVKIPDDIKILTQLTKGDTIISPVKLAAFECDPVKMTETMMDFIYSSKNGLKAGFNKLEMWIAPVFSPGGSI